jgi:2'-5' RNA ligase
MERKQTTNSLYFIAIILPGPHFELAQELKIYFGKQYNSKASLQSPPHITLHMPFSWLPSEEVLLLEKLADFCAQQQPFHIAFKNFGCFEPQVVFIDVEKTKALADFQNRLSRFCRMELNLFNANHKGNPFHPHVTLAFRDLKKKAFTIAWNEFKGKEFSGEFLAEQIALLKHNGKVWEVFRTFDLQKLAT